MAISLHRRRTRWTITAICAVALSIASMNTIGAAQRARSRWGDTTAVAIAARSIAPGEVIGAGDIELVDRPNAVIPDGAVTDDAIGRTAIAAIPAGEMLLDLRLAPAGRDGVGALAPVGSLGFAVPIDTTTPPLAVGDRVDVFAPSATAAKATTATRIAQGATVVDLADRTVTIAVGPSQAPAVARALLDTAVVLALSD